MKRARMMSGLLIATLFTSCFADYEKLREGGNAGAPDAGTAGTAETSGASGTAGTVGGNGTAGANDMTYGGMGGTSSTIPIACGVRDCSSNLDNDCLYGPDAQEKLFCECSVPTQTCPTGKPGACSTGTRTCIFSANRSMSAWGDCIAPAAGLRDCRSDADNDCDGDADASEPDCGGCNSETPPACTLPQDGIGTCRAGTPSRTYGEDGSTCTWQCAGRQEPTNLEACGPLSAGGTPTPDANCNGIAGDGPSCGLKVLHIYRASRSGSCSCNGWSGMAYTASLTGSPGSDWTEISKFMVFTGTQPSGTVAVQNCAASPLSYVTIGTSCSGSSTILGYVSKSQSTGYEQLKQVRLSISGCESVPNVNVPLSSNSTVSGSSISSYYVVPITP
ncbi:MAG: hypothetical protein QM784_17770 [Polyangiaceae bacterium]